MKVDTGMMAGALDDIGAMVRPSCFSRARISLRRDGSHHHVVAVVAGHRVERAAAGHQHQAGDALQRDGK